MRANLIVAILVFSLASPIASSHGANDFSIIMRGSSIQPSQADILQNDTLTFYNVVDYNRTIRVDLDGDGSYDQRCDTEPWNSSSIRDECTFYVDAMSWAPGDYQFHVFSNETIWAELNVIVSHDLHEEMGPPAGYTFNSENNSGQEEGEESWVQLWNLAIGIFVAYGLVVLTRGGKDE
ncbi:MAG: hypothetical protein CMA88_04220 [Euryarchaeota archaeon]|nr:hypothetical protein [Euryarchaeota archaeon]